MVFFLIIVFHSSRLATTPSSICWVEVISICLWNIWTWNTGLNGCQWLISPVYESKDQVTAVRILKYRVTFISVGSGRKTEFVCPLDGEKVLTWCVEMHISSKIWPEYWIFRRQELTRINANLRWEIIFCRHVQFVLETILLSRQPPPKKCYGNLIAKVTANRA